MSSYDVASAAKKSVARYGTQVATAFAAVLAVLGAPSLNAQDRAGSEAPYDALAQQEAPPPSQASPPPSQATPRESIDLTITVPRAESDRQLVEDCEEENEIARIRGEIVVCRRLGETSDGSWNREQWERDYAARTKGPQPVGVAGPGIFTGKPSVSGLCVIPPCPDDPALMIDVEALPEAPEGSDADRIARGLPPTGEGGEPTAEQIAERRRALGLDTPPIPEE